MSNRYLAYFLAMAGLAGVLYGLGTNGVMSIAKPYIEATTGFDAVHLSLLVGCCLLGSVCVNFVAGTLSDWFGRRKMFLLGAILFAFGSFVVGGAHREFGAMYCGILTQGLGMGIVAVVMPMYIAETLPKEIRGRGTGFFQLVMIGGILASGLIGLALSFCVGPADSPTLGLAEKEWCWHVVYWIVGGLAAGIFVAGLFLRESPVWLARKSGRRAARCDKAEGTSLGCDAGSVFQRRYMVPFAIAFTILACNQATGINAVLGYTTTIFKASGLSLHAINVADVVLKVAMFVMTAVACMLVDRKGRVFLLELGTRGIVSQARIPCGVRTDDNSFWMDVSPRSLQNLLQILDTCRRKLLKANFPDCPAKFDDTVRYEVAGCIRTRYTGVPSAYYAGLPFRVNVRREAV